MGCMLIVQPIPKSSLFVGTKDHQGILLPAEVRYAADVQGLTILQSPIVHVYTLYIHQAIDKDR